MKLYIIEDNYIEYLTKFSDNVKFNKNNSRPYVGIILQIEEYNYFAPLGSPKEKHFKMKETIDFIKIESGKYGVININNMIPVSDKYIINIDINTFDKEYSKLLLEQERWINRNERKII